MSYPLLQLRPEEHHSVCAAPETRSHKPQKAVSRKTRACRFIQAFYRCSAFLQDVPKLGFILGAVKSKAPSYSCMGTGHFQDLSGLGFCPNVGSQGTNPLTQDTAWSFGDKGGRTALAVLEASWIMFLPLGYKRSEWLGVEGRQQKTHWSSLSSRPEPPCSHQSAGHHMENSSLLGRVSRLLGPSLKAAVPTLC